MSTTIHVYIDPKIQQSYQFIMDTLNHRHGWTKFYKTLTFKQIYDSGNADLRFMIVKQPFVDCNETACKFLNAYDPDTHTIYINRKAWYGGTPYLPKSLDLHWYRMYIINHEVGHFLGHGHKNNLRQAIAPVMMQQTLGLKGCQLPNPFPTKADFE